MNSVFFQVCYHNKHGQVIFISFQFWPAYQIILLSFGRLIHVYLFTYVEWLIKNEFSPVGILFRYEKITVSVIDEYSLQLTPLNSGSEPAVKLQSSVIRIRKMRKSAYWNIPCNYRKHERELNFNQFSENISCINSK